MLKNYKVLLLLAVVGISLKTYTKNINLIKQDKPDLALFKDIESDNQYVFMLPNKTIADPSDVAVQAYVISREPVIINLEEYSVPEYISEKLEDRIIKENIEFRDMHNDRFRVRSRYGTMIMLIKIS